MKYCFSARTDFFDMVADSTNIYANGVFTVHSYVNEDIVTLTGEMTIDEARAWDDFFSTFASEDDDAYGGFYDEACGSIA